jgi:S-(hydroxymethyl)glutathione dehydrogenase / alcohol dehydrogenase
MTAIQRPRVTRAAILVAQRQPLVVDEIELPEELGYGQVLVEVRHSGVCGSQLGEIDGVKGEDPFLPHLLGHEGAGQVIAIGPGVKTVHAGERVVLHWMKGRGIEAEPPTYRWQGRRLNAGWVTTFNGYAVVSENRVTAVPETTDLEVAALLGCAVTTGLGVVKNNARLTAGESIAIFGAGGVGLNVVQGAALASAWPIIAVDLFDAKLQLASRLGATHTINARIADVRAEIGKIVGTAGVDVAVDNTGDPRVIEMAYELTARQGRTVLVGVPKAGGHIAIHSLPLHFGKSLAGSHGGESQPSRDIPRYLRLIDAGKLALDHLVTDRYGLDDINEAIAAMREGRVAGRCMIELHREPTRQPSQDRSTARPEQRATASV